MHEFLWIGSPNGRQDQFLKLLYVQGHRASEEVAQPLQAPHTPNSSLNSHVLDQFEEAVQISCKALSKVPMNYLKLSKHTWNEGGPRT